MTSSVLSITPERMLRRIVALLALGVLAGCMSTTGSPPRTSTSAQPVYGSDGHYGGWGTGFGSDGSRGRG